MPGRGFVLLFAGRGSGLAHKDWVYEVRLARLREQLKLGIDQLDAGAGTAINSRSALNSLFDDIKA